jgi:mono/diheme cytochrome c family protein
MSPGARSAAGKNFMSSPKSGRSRFALILSLAVGVSLAASSAGAQENLDSGKPPQKLFAETCTSCHRSAGGLAKGRFIYLYLQKHYASNSSSAWALASYLESVDSGKRAAAAPRPKAVSTSRTSLRPPMPVPGR